MPRKQKQVVPKLDMETPSLANIEFFEWKQQIENAKDDPAKLREINEQQAAIPNQTIPCDVAGIGAALTPTTGQVRDPL